MTLLQSRIPTTAGKLVGGHAGIQMIPVTTMIEVEERKSLPEQSQKRKFHSTWLKKLRERFQFDSSLLFSLFDFIVEFYIQFFLSFFCSGYKSCKKIED
jgi:hypothetical protein